MKKQIEVVPENFEAVHTAVEQIMNDGKKVLRVIKSEKINLYDENTYAKVKNVMFHNGIIEVKMKSRLLPDAPDFARGFIGIAYRANSSDSEFESFYVRPTNGRDCEDAVRKSHGCQYFSYPGYTFSYFREYQISEYEAPINLALDEWFTITAVIEDCHAAFYLNHDQAPVLVVEKMKHGMGQHGSLGIFVDIGTEALISEISITCAD